MRKLILTLSILSSAFMSYAATLSLNNATPSAGTYTSWTTAQAAASNGDTILVQGSLTNYGSLNVSKQLTIIGPGHNPIDKQNLQKVFCDNVLFTTGSDGSVLIGVEAGNIQAYSNNVDNISILNCRILDAVYFSNANANNWLIDGCVFTNGGHCLRADGNGVGDLIVRNNIFNGTIYAFNVQFIGYNYFNNNVFLAATPYTFQYCRYQYMNNNIFYRSGMQDYANSGMNFNKNLSYQCQGGNAFPNGFNYENVDPMFVSSLGTGAYFDYSTDYHLQLTSPVITGGTDGTELGIYGGVGDFDQYGFGHNPYIKTFNITGPTSVNAGDPIQVYIKAKVRN